MKTYKSNSREVSEKVQKHVKSVYYGTIEDLKNDVVACNGAENMIDGGSFSIYYDDQRAFLNSLHLNNNSNREFSDQDVYTMYKLLVSRAINKLTKGE